MSFQTNLIQIPAGGILFIMQQYCKKPTVSELVDAFPEFYEEAKKRVRSITRDLPYQKAFRRINDYSIPEEQKSFLKYIWLIEMRSDSRVKEIDRLQHFIKVFESKKKDKEKIDIERARMTPISGLYPFQKVRRHYKKTKARCPFHEERHPSFFIYHETNTFYCFSCHVGGDAIKFIMLVEGLDFYEAVKRLGG